LDLEIGATLEFQYAPYERRHSGNCERIRRIISLGWVFLLFGLPALWNVYPVKRVACLTGAQPIPLGSPKSKKKITLRALCDFAVNYYRRGRNHQTGEDLMLAERRVVWFMFGFGQTYPYGIDSMIFGDLVILLIQGVRD